MWYIGQCELRSLKYDAKCPQVVNWAMWAKNAPYFKLLSSPCPMYQMRMLCTIFKFLNSPCSMYHLRSLCTSVLRWYIGQGELRNLNMVQSVLSWYIGQGELRSLKYGAKRPQVVHWAMWAKKFKVWCKATSDLCIILNFLAHIAQCTTWGPFAPYFILLSSHCTMYHLRATQFKYGAKIP
jgi:hypothetical protein